MRRIWLIARRECVEGIRRPAFVWTSLLLPALLIGYSFIGASANIGQEDSLWLNDDEAALVLGSILSVMTYFFVLVNGTQIMNSVVEEKANRIVEVIVSAVHPVELLLGKILGVAVVGLVQIAIGGIVLGVASCFLADVPFLSSVSVPFSADAVALVGIFLLYFMGGYLLYASIYAAFASAVDQAGDAGQYTMPVTLLLLLSLWIGIYSMQELDGVSAFWCSMVPFTSPVVMMMRVPFGLPWYELVISLLLLYGVAFGMLWLSARIYRTGILMYGRKFSLREILRWVR